jgi:hypothetical protein
MRAVPSAEFLGAYCLRTDAGGAGSPYIDPVLAKALGVSIVLHLVIIGLIGNDPRNADFSGKHAVSVLNATLAVRREELLFDTSQISESATPQRVPESDDSTPAKEAEWTFSRPVEGASTSLQRTDSPLEPRLPLPPHYHVWSELDSPPFAVAQPANDATSVLPADIPHGEVAVALWINDAGGVDRFEILSSDLPDESRDALLRPIIQATYMPGKIHGNAVHAYIRVELKFRREPPRHANKLSVQKIGTN